MVFLSVYITINLLKIAIVLMDGHKNFIYDEIL